MFQIQSHQREYRKDISLSYPTNQVESKATDTNADANVKSVMNNGSSYKIMTDAILRGGAAGLPIS